MREILKQNKMKNLKQIPILVTLIKFTFVYKLQ